MEELDQELLKMFFAAVVREAGGLIRISKAAVFDVRETEALGFALLEDGDTIEITVEEYDESNV